MDDLAEAERNVLEVLRRRGSPVPSYELIQICNVDGWLLNQLRKAGLIESKEGGWTLRTRR